MKRIIIVCSLICVTLFLVVFSSACTPTPTAPVENPFTTQIKSVDAKVTAAEAKIAEFDKILAKLDTRNFVDITAYNAKVADLQAKITAAEAKNTALETKITALETWKTGLGTANPVTPTPPSGGTTTGQVTFTTSITPLQSWGNGANQSFILIITNGTNQWKYVRPGFVLQTPLPGAAITAGNLNIMMQCGSSIFNAGDFLFTPALGATARTSIDAAPYTGGEDTQGQLYIGPGQVKNCSVSLTTTSAPPAVLWTVSVNLRVSQ